MEGRNALLRFATHHTLECSWWTRRPRVASRNRRVLYLRLCRRHEMGEDAARNRREIRDTGLASVLQYRCVKSNNPTKFSAAAQWPVTTFAPRRIILPSHTMRP